VMARSTTSVLIKVVDFGRDQSVGVDRLVHRLGDRILRRQPDVLRGPPLLLDSELEGDVP